MICPECGRQISDNSRICQYCGKWLESKTSSDNKTSFSSASRTHEVEARKQVSVSTGRKSSGKNVLIAFAIIFGVAAIILFFSSVRQLDSSVARAYGTSAVINIQDTVFCAACAVMCVVNAVGAIVLNSIES